VSTCTELCQLSSADQTDTENEAENLEIPFIFVEQMVNASAATSGHSRITCLAYWITC